MKKIGILAAMMFLASTSVQAAPTSAVLGGSVTINEVLYNPVGSPGFDTDGNGTVASNDEFVELYNGGNTPVDISAWELWDSGSGNWFTFPGTTADDGTTILPANSYAVVIMGVQSGGSLPTMSNPNSLAFDNGRGSGLINNTNDNVVLYDPGADEFIQLFYNGDVPDDPPISYNSFSGTAIRVGSQEDWGNGVAGKSLTRFPSGDSAVGVHDVIVPGGPNASPTAVALLNFRSSQTNWLLPTLLAGLLLTTAGVLIHRRRTT